MPSRTDFSITPVGAHIRNASIASVTTLTVPSNANGIIMQAGTANVRYTLNGTNPTSTLGFSLSSTGTPTRIDLYPGAQVKVISSTGALNYQFFTTSLTTHDSF